MSVKFPKERYLNNFIDKTFQDMLVPLDIPMSLLMIPKYSLDGFVTPNSRLRNLKTVMMNLLLLTVVYFRLTTSIVLKFASPEFNTIIFTLYIDVFFYSFTLSCFCWNNIINTDHNTNLILNLQNTFRNFRYTEKDMKPLTIWNWASMVMIPVYYSIFMIIAYSGDVLGLLMNFLPLLYYDVSMVYVTRVLCIITHQLKMWVREINRCNGVSESTIPAQKMFESYCSILNAFVFFKKISMVPISLQIVETTCHALMYLQVNLEVEKQNTGTSSLIDQISVFMWVVKNCTLLSIVSFALDKFYYHVQQAVEVCTMARKLDLPDETRQLCKNVRRCTNARFEHLEVCGVRVDARFPLRLAGVITTYIVVLLQFNMS